MPPESLCESDAWFVGSPRGLVIGTVVGIEGAQHFIHRWQSAQCVTVRLVPALQFVEQVEWIVAFLVVVVEVVGDNQIELTLLVKTESNPRGHVERLLPVFHGSVSVAEVSRHGGGTGIIQQVMIIVFRQIIAVIVGKVETEPDVVVVGRTEVEVGVKIGVRAMSLVLAARTCAVDGVLSQQSACIGCHDAVHPCLAQLACHIFRQGCAGAV